MTALGAGPHSTVSPRAHHTQGREKPLGPRCRRQGAVTWSSQAIVPSMIVPFTMLQVGETVPFVATRMPGTLFPLRASLPLNHFQRIVTPSAGSTTASFSGAR